MIKAKGLTKRYGGRTDRTGKTVVDRLTFTVEPGAVTGFLGPNGAGKSTTMRMILGLDAPTARPRHRHAAAPTPRTPRRSTRSAPCWRPAPCTRAAPPTTT